MRRYREEHRVAGKAGGPQPFLPPQPNTPAEDAAIARMMRRPATGGYLTAMARLDLLDRVAWVNLLVPMMQTAPLPQDRRAAAVAALKVIDADLKAALDALHDEAKQPGPKGKPGVGVDTIHENVLGSEKKPASEEAP